MPDPQSVLQIVQLAPEVTAGTAVSASKRLRSMQIEFQPQANVDSFKSSGYKVSTLTAINKEWMQANVTGEPTYDEIIYPLSVLSKGTPAAGTAGGGTAYTWDFDFDSDGADTQQTFTVERGDANQAYRFAYGLFNEFSLTVTRQDAQITGQLLGQRLETGISLSGTAALVDLVPILPKQFDLYLADTQAGLDSADPLDRAFSAKWSVTSRHTPIWPIRSANTSFAAAVEAKNLGMKFDLQLGADATGIGLLTTLRAGSSKFLRLKAVGANTAAGTAYPYTFKLDFSGQITAAPNMADQDDVYVWNWSFDAIHDATWGRAVRATVINTQSGY